MSKLRKLRLLTAVLAMPAGASAVLAQAPAGLPPVQSVPFNGSALPPTSPIPGVGSPVGIAPTPGLPTSPTLASFLGLSNAQREFRQRALADTPFGELRSKIRQPLSDATGGLIPPIPPATPALAELMDPGPVGAAAKVKLDRAAAKKRIKAVQYLGTVDCHYWPEAEDALVNALRADRNEWVRLSAAQTLLRGCCCTKKTILALTMAATCSNADGNPAEKSPRVVAAAQAALSKCLEGLCCSPAIMSEGVIYDGGVPDGGTVPQPKKEVPKGEGEKVAVAKPGPAGAEKGAGGLSFDQLATPSTRELYDRAAARPWGEMIAFSKAHLAKAPAVPAEYLHEALTDINAGDDDAPTAAASGGSAPAVARRERPANLYDALFADTNTARVPAPRPYQPVVPAYAMTAAAPTRVAPMMNAVPAAARPAQPIRLAVSVPARPAAPTPAPVPVMAPAPVVRQAAMTAPARVGLTPAAVKAMDALDGKDAKGIATAVELLGPIDVSVNGPVPTALVKTAEDHADPDARTACVRALARCKARTPGVVAGLERLVSDRNVDVRVEAAVALNELKAK